MQLKDESIILYFIPCNVTESKSTFKYDGRPIGNPPNYEGKNYRFNFLQTYFYINIAILQSYTFLQFWP